LRAVTQVIAVTSMSLRALPARFGTSVVVVVGVAAVVAVLISVLAMATGFAASAAKSGRTDRAIVLSQSAFSESGSQIQRAVIATITDAPGVRIDSGGRAIASAEALAYFPVVEERTGRDTMVTLRGVSAEAFALRPEMQIAEGRMFTPALREVVVGRAAATRLEDITVGSEIYLPEGGWTVVGVFESGGDSHESELLTDANTLIAAFNRGDVFNSVTVALEDAQALQRFTDALTTNPALSVTVRRESDYFADTSRPIGRLLAFIAYFIGGVMALGAVFAALNTM
jgi:putative ABC transport system permease protein